MSNLHEKDFDEDDDPEYGDDLERESEFDDPEAVEELELDEDEDEGED